jgi:hypothetical protein
MRDAKSNTFGVRQKSASFSKTVVVPEVAEQLRIWAVDLNEEAEQVERRAAEGEEAEQPMAKPV